uniref:Uncharacterized protein n=1 Tax=Utricularia reniformis TaxID=192314 RepID=A0A1Y0B328_9LAMI|nr:hypothetical protein AEK19_MT1663 [Utricularia reniformis]ART31846.1 hypothetical protein AEK19_MT1663 [Utricularia reniformis]
MFSFCENAVGLQAVKVESDGLKRCLKAFSLDHSTPSETVRTMFNLRFFPLPRINREPFLLYESILFHSNSFPIPGIGSQIDGLV